MEMEWVRGEIIGRGSFSTINIATPRNHSPLMAVKSAVQAKSSMLHREKGILSCLGGSPRILRCLGDDTTFEDGEEVYNVFLELASRGNLAELVKNSGGRMEESHVRYYTRMILQGLCYIHERNYVHCDIKLQNILVCDSSSDIKIGDFGLAKKVGEKSVNGTPLYMSPESVTSNEQETPSDIWALGCIVLEMITGKPAWRYGTDADVSSLLFRIGFTDELPEIPKGVSEQGRDFLEKCLVRDPVKRWTAEMLMDHPFVADQGIVALPEFEPSPRSAFGFPDWTPRSDCCNVFGAEGEELDSSAACRIQPLAVTQPPPNWSTSDGWFIVRKEGSPVSQ